MKSAWLVTVAIFAFAHSSVHAIDVNYARKLERSGCTQVSELQGCDITKTRAENAKAGFGTGAPAGSAPAASPPAYKGQWMAVGPSGATVAIIRINEKNQVWVNDKPVKAKRSGGALVFKQGFITYTVQVDKNAKGENTWSDSDAGTTGKIVAR